MRPPNPHPFLAAEAGEPAPDADAILVGLATDGGVSFRPGAAQGPSGIREFSESIESYSLVADRDLSDLRLIDAGDIIDRQSIESTIGSALSRTWSGDKRPLLASLGGDHSVTPPTVSAVAAHVEGLAVVGFDAHLDLREDYPGDHACTYRRIADRGVRSFVFGVRSGSREEWRAANEVLAYHSGPSVWMPDHVLKQLVGRPVYVTIDIDVLDPSVAPGTGNPEPGGPDFEELTTCFASLAMEGIDVVAFDLVEVSPPLDPSGITQATAAVLAREAILRFARPR